MKCFESFQCVKSKSVTNLAEATADPALDQHQLHQPAPNQIEVHPLVEGVMNIDLPPERFHGPERNEGIGLVRGAGIGGGAGVVGGAIGGVGLAGNVNFNPPGSPLLRPAINPNEPYPDQIPPEENI